MAKNQNILILCSRLDLPGGIERAIVNTANLLNSKGHDVSILILDITAELFYPLNDQIRVIRAPLNFGITGKGNVFSRKMIFLRHVYMLELKIKELNPNVVLSTEYPFTIAAFFATEKLHRKLFAWEHHHFHHLVKSKFWNQLYRKVYPKVSGVICLNEDEAGSYRTLGCSTFVIPNFIQQKAQADLGAKCLLTIGWLSKTKGIDLVPIIAERVFANYPDWHWKMIGSGDEEKWLKEELAQKKLEQHVLVISPSTHEIDNEYLSSSIYVMTSRFECFPMVLLEAMSHGLPSVAFDCPTGPRHIITDRKNGFLLQPGDANAMADTIQKLIGDKEMRQDLGNHAYQSVSRFHPDKIYALWENVFSG